MQLRVLSIPPGRPFLRTLARGFLAGEVVPGFRHDPADPLALAGATMLVPSRRAARMLAGEFAAALGGGPAILPAIRIVGEADEAASFLLPGAAETALAPVVGAMERRLILARMVRRWRRLTTREETEELIEHDIPPPASAADALHLARDLCELLDEAENEGVGFDGLAGLAPEALSDWWRMTLDFLAILTRHWPDILAARGLVSEASARNAAERALAARLTEKGSPGPMVIAGSTATAPASVELMRAVARLPNGALVLPGLDRDLDAAGWQAIDVGRAIASPGHPQYAAKRILARLQLPPEAVDHLGGADDPAEPARARERLLSLALRPAETTEVWAAAGAAPPGAVEGLSLVEAPDERTEALAAAIAIRHALEEPNATAALVTPDRNLARRVVAELRRFGIEANDSAGRPLAATAPGAFLLLVLDASLRPGDPLALVSLLKHPLLRAGMPPGEARRAARAIETLALRGRVGVPDAARLPELLARALEDVAAAKAHLSRAVRLVGPNDRELATRLAERLAAALEPLTRLRGGEAGELAAFGPVVTRVVEACAADPEGSASGLYAFETGEALAGFLSDLVDAPLTGFNVEPGDLPDVVRALLSDRSVRPRGGLSTRAFVLGTIEARLQHVDLAVLAGLNEGTWPAGAKSGAFLSRLMRSELSLEPPERRIGLAAHDFWMAAGAPEVVLSRSLRSGNAPTIASRWLQRLLAVAGPEGAKTVRGRGEPYLDHARLLDRPPAGPPATAPRPSPRPPLAHRPTRYSVTEVETLIRDPYAIHARRILRLEPMPDLIRSPSATERGILFHQILGEFVQDGHDPAGPDAEAILLAYAAESFREAQLPPETHAVWWPRMETLARNVVAWEREREPRVAKRLAELQGAVEFPDIDIRLTGRADRVDVMRDGSLEIIDFKTGSGPSVRQARTLLAPQLPLEAAMARFGGFAAGGAPAAPVGELLFLRLKERAVEPEPLSKEASATSEAITADDLACRAHEKFRGLAALYADPATSYPSRARPYMAGDFSGPYDHLARAREWSAGAEDGE